MERITANTQERRRHIRTLLNVRRLELSRGSWSSTWNRILLSAFYLGLQWILLRILYQYVRVLFDIKDLGIEAGSSFSGTSVPTGSIPGLSLGLQSSLIILFGLGIIIALVSCVMDINDRRLSMTPIDMRSVIGAEFLHQIPELTLFVGPGMIFVFIRYCWTTAAQLNAYQVPSAVPGHVFAVLLLSFFFGILLFLLMILIGMTLGIVLSWLTRMLRWDLFSVQVDQLLFLGIAVIAAVAIGFALAGWWSNVRNLTYGVVWFPFVGTVIVRGLAGVGRLYARVQDAWRGIWQMLVIMAGSGALFALAARFLTPHLAMMPEIHSSGSRVKKARAVHKSSFRSLPSMLAKDLRTFFRGGDSFTGLTRWAMVWILMSLLWAVTFEGTQPQGFKEYWVAFSGMRVGWVGFLLFIAFQNVLPFILFFLLLAESRAALLVHTVPARLRQLVWYKQVAALFLGGAGIGLWELCFARSPFRLWSPLLLFLVLWDEYIWMSVLVTFLVPFFVQRDEREGLTPSVYATPLMLAIVYAIQFGLHGIGGFIPAELGFLAFRSAGSALWPAFGALVIGFLVLRFVAVPICAFVLGRRLKPATAKQEEQTV